MKMRKTAFLAALTGKTIAARRLSIPVNSRYLFLFAFIAMSSVSLFASLIGLLWVLPIAILGSVYFRIWKNERRLAFARVMALRQTAEEMTIPQPMPMIREAAPAPAVGLHRTLSRLVDVTPGGEATAVMQQVARVSVPMYDRQGRKVEGSLQLYLN